MKNAIALVLSLFVLATSAAGTARAGNEGPFASPGPDTGTIAEVRQFGGFAPLPNHARGLRILKNGAVIFFHGQETRHLASLTTEVLEQVQAKADAIVASQLIDENQGQGQCMDAPTTTYEVPRADGRIEFARVENCHRFHSSQSEAYTLEHLLSGLRALADLE